MTQEVVAVETLGETSPNQVYQNRLDVIRSRYSRLGSDENSQAAKRPIWLARMALVYAQVELHEAKAEETEAGDIAGPIDHFSSKLRVMTRFPATRSLEDVEELDLIIKSFGHFKPGYGYKRGSSEAGIFVDDLVGLISEGGATPGSIASYFRLLEGAITVNPALLPTFFSGSGISPLEGVIPELEPGRLALEKLSVLEKKELESSSQEANRILERVIRVKRNEGKNSLENIQDFLIHVEELLKVYNDDGLEKILNSVQNLLKYFSVLDGQEVVFDVIRPELPQSIYAPLVIALGEHFSSTETDETQNLEISQSLVGTIRRGRIALSKESLFGFLVAFRERKNINADYLPSEALNHAGNALDIFDKYFTAFDVGEKVEIKRNISDVIIPNLILQLRVEGYSLFDWTRADYEALGVNDLWDEHKVILQNQNKINEKGPEIFEKGSVLLDLTAQVQPTTSSHVELAREIGFLSIRDLKRCGILDVETESVNVFLGMSVNSGNPHKEDWPYREEMLRASLSGLKNVFVWSDKKNSSDRIEEVQGFTITKLKSHNTFLEKSNKLPVVHVRVGGTEHLDKMSGTYTGLTEKLGSDELNEMKHIFALQRDELKDASVLIEILRTTYVNFPNAIIFLPAVPDVHSSYFRDDIKYLSQETLSTLVHPAIIPTLKELVE